MRSCPQDYQGFPEAFHNVWKDLKLRLHETSVSRALDVQLIYFRYVSVAESLVYPDRLDPRNGPPEAQSLCVGRRLQSEDSRRLARVGAL
jgi:hypothetical protein